MVVSHSHKNFHAFPRLLCKLSEGLTHVNSRVTSRIPAFPPIQIQPVTVLASTAFRFHTRLRLDGGILLRNKSFIESPAGMEVEFEFIPTGLSHCVAGSRAMQT